MKKTIRTFRQSLSGGSSTELEGSGGSGALQGLDVVSLSILPESGTTMMRGNADDDWVQVPSAGISLNANLDSLPTVKDDGNGSVIRIIYEVNDYTK